MEKKIYIINESDQGNDAQDTFELISFAMELSCGKLPAVILLGSRIEAQARELSEKTGCDTFGVTGDDLGLFNAQAYCHAIMDILPHNTPLWLCLPHTSMGYDLAPLLAVKLNAACITAVDGIRSGTLVRSIHSGRFIIDITAQTPSAVVTVIPGAFLPFEPGMTLPGSIRMVQASLPPLKSRTLGIEEPMHRDSTLKDAEVIVSAGRGVGKKENMALIKGLAALFPKSAVGASRQVCDLGWLEYRHQVGTTGQTVAPKLYIACGISGAIQHVSGMKKAQNIIAINIDPNAAIFRVAHICIVEDLTTFIPILIEEMKGSDSP
jgi:electron transfer flavoprotein alpha subunit